MKRDYTNFQELADLWLVSQAHITESSRSRYEYAVQSLAGHFSTLNGGLKESCEAWQIKRRASCSPQTFNLELSIATQILAFGMARGKPTGNPAAEIRCQRVIRKEVFVPGLEQFTAICELLSHQESGSRVVSFLKIMAFSGMRKTEVSELRWGDVDFVGKSLTVGRNGNTKNGKARVLPLFAELAAILTLLAQAPHEACDLVIGSVDVRYWLSKACLTLDLPHFGANHTFRRFFVRQCLKAGCDAPTVAKFVGHSDGGKLVLSTYNILADSALSEGAAKVNARAVLINALGLALQHQRMASCLLTWSGI